jgi:hypothetical protein
VLGSEQQILAEVSAIIRTLWKASYFVWGTIALILAVIRLEGGGDPYSWIWIGCALAVPPLNHLASKRSRNPLPVVRRELLVAACLQGAAVALIQFQPVPSFAIAAPLAGFVLFGGLRLLGLGALSFVAGLLMAGAVTGFDVDFRSGAATLTISAVLLIANQLNIARFTLKHAIVMRSFRDGADNITFIDDLTEP